MGEEKPGKRIGGLLVRLFDWKKKSTKKLLSDASALSDSTNRKQFGDDRTTSIQEISEEGSVGVTASVRSGDSCCSSLIIDVEENTIRAPGVVARLMGLDSMPCSSELNVSSFYDWQSSERNSFKIGCSNLYGIGQFNNVVGRNNGCSSRTAETRTLKLPSSPIERFQTETMPLKSVNFSPVSHHKNLLTMKNPASIPHRMEPLAKSFDHSSQKSGFLKAKSFGLSSSASRIKTSEEGLTKAGPVRPTKSAGSLKISNISQDGIIHQSSLSINSNSRYYSKGHVNEVNLLANQVIVNSQVKDQSISKSRKKMVNSQKSRQFNTLPQKAAVVLRNNNPMESKENFGSSAFSNLQRSKVQAKNLSSDKKPGNKLPGRAGISYKKCSSVITDKNQGSKVQGKNLSSKKKTGNKLPGCDDVIDTQSCSVTSGKDEQEEFPFKLTYKKGFKENESISSKNRTAMSDSEMDSYEKHVHHNFVTDENSRWMNNNIKNDIVSFTFSTPIIKPGHGRLISSLLAQTGDEKNENSLDISIEEKASCRATENHSCDVLNNIDGDALGILLEEKLNELATRINSQSKAIDLHSSVVLRETLSESNDCLNSPDKHEDFQYDYSSDDAKVYDMKEDGQPDIDWTETSSCSSSSTTNLDVQKEPHQESPLSILEASFSSNESYNSPDGLGCTNVQDSADITCTSPLEEQLQVKLSDSVYGHNENMNDDMKYVRELLRNASLMSDYANPLHFARLGYTLDPLLFEELECRKSWNGCRHRRKLLFDCSSECLDLKLSLYFGSGYRAWSRGLLIVGKDLAQMVCEEIALWRNMEDFMIDELLERDMSNHQGRWIDFDLEAFEAGAEIERGLLSSLVEELVSDFLVR